MGRRSSGFWEGLGSVSHLVHGQVLLYCWGLFGRIGLLDNEMVNLVGVHRFGQWLYAFTTANENVDGLIRSVHKLEDQHR